MSEGMQTAIALLKESVYGVKAVGQYKSMNFVSQNLTVNVGGKKSKTVRKDGQLLDYRKTTNDSEGKISTEFQPTNLDYILPGLLWDIDWVSPGTLGNTVSFAAEGVPGDGGIITFHANDAIDILPGQFIQLEGDDLNAANSGIFKVKAVSGKDVTVYSPLFTELNIADVVLKGDRIRNGTTQTSYSIEVASLDVSKFNLFIGQVPSSFEVKIEEDEIITVDANFVGKDDIPSDASASTGEYTNLSELPVLNASDVGSFYADGIELPSCQIQKIQFNFDKKAKPIKCVGSDSTSKVSGSSIDLSGSISMFFEDHIEYLKFKNGTAFSFDTTINDEYGNIYVLELAKIKYKSSKSDISGKDDTRMIDQDFIGMMGENGYTIQINRMLA